MWYRVFGASAVEPSPDAILDFLNRIQEMHCRFHGDDRGWFHADLAAEDISLSLDRYTVDEEGVRAQLNTWAAFVESRADGGELTRLMERLIQSQQLFVLHRPAAAGSLLCVWLSAQLAQWTDGVYQIDGKGFFDRDGNFLLPDE
jgi:hypothetical protein